MKWTPEDDARLASLVEEGLTSTMIAAQFHVNKGSILSRARRIKIAWKQKPESTQPSWTERKKQAARERGLTTNTNMRRILIARARAKGRLPAIEDHTTKKHKGSTTTLMGLTNHHCRWPIGPTKRSGFTFCGAMIEKAPYCDKHRKIAYTKRTG